MQQAEERLAPKVEEAALQASACAFAMNVPGGFVSDEGEIREGLTGCI